MLHDTSLTQATSQTYIQAGENDIRFMCAHCYPMGRHQDGHHKDFLHYYIDTSKPFRHRFLSQNMFWTLNSNTKHPGKCYKPQCP